MPLVTSRVRARSSTPASRSRTLVSAPGTRAAGSRRALDARRQRGRRGLAEHARRRDRDRFRTARSSRRGRSSGRSARRSADARPELLDRYLVVSQLAPQLQHVIELVRPVYGVARHLGRRSAGTCPNLRSLSMLLIEELDFEVETLDSADLLDAGCRPSLANPRPRCNSPLPWHRSRMRSRPADLDAPGTRTSTIRAPSSSASASGACRRRWRSSLAAAWSVRADHRTRSRCTSRHPARRASATVAAAPAPPDLRAEATIGRDRAAARTARAASCSSRRPPATVATAGVAPRAAGAAFVRAASADAAAASRRR